MVEFMAGLTVISFHSIVIRGLNEAAPVACVRTNASTVEMVLSTDE